MARGLAWCGRVDDELNRFRQEVDRLIHSSAVEDIVSSHLNELYQSLLDRLLDPLLERAVKPVLIDWRDGKLRTLSQLGPVLQERIRLFLYSREAMELLFEPVNDWVQLVSSQLERQTSGICRRYHVPDRSLSLSTHLTASDFQDILGRIGTNEMFPGQPLVGAAVLVESIISVLVGLLCGGSGVVLIAEGPLGIVIGIVSSFLLFAVAHVLGKKAVDQKIMNADLPLAVRRIALARPLPKLESPGLHLGGLLKDDGDAGKEKSSGKPGLKLLPQLVFAGHDEISERRMRAIRQKIRAAYTESISDESNEAFRELSGKICREVSEQIEQRLKTLAEQVEIPL